MKAISDFISDFGPGRANITVNTAIYALDAIHAASYPFIAGYHVLITPDADGSVTVVFEAKGEGRDITADLKEFATSLIDHQVRLRLDQANGKIRDLIVTHAFAPLDLQKEAEAL
jgi:His-Xaa-Ser system protein HxsD